MSIPKNLCCYLYLCLLVLSSCKKELPKTQEQINRTVMVYMAANNNLANEAYENINQMERAFKNTEGTLLVYVKLKNENPAVYQIEHDETVNIKSKKIITYNSHNAVDPEVMKTVIADMQAHAPSSSYGLILWSHASSWFPAKSQILSNITVQSFGDDEGKEMDLLDLTSALPNNLDFILFDACSMASIEVLYQLKDKAAYILASPSEVIAGGMPYHLLTNALFNTDLKQGLTAAAKIYYDFYNQQQGLYQSATITLTETSKLKNLATQTNQFLKSNPNHTLSRANVQRLDFATGTLTESFDFIDTFEKNYAKADIKSLQEALNAAMIYKAHTNSFNGQKINVYSGISIYIPNTSSNLINEYYKKLDWHLAIH